MPAPRPQYVASEAAGMLGLGPAALRPKFLALALKPTALTLALALPHKALWARSLGLVVWYVIFFNGCMWIFSAKDK